MIRTIKNLENSIHKTNEWINEINDRLDWNDEQKTYTALEATLHLIRDMLTVEEATDFGSQLPLILRGSYYTNWDPSETPISIDKSTFVSRVHAYLDNDPDIEPSVAVRRILQFMNKKITEGEIGDVKAQLPEDIQDFWKT